MLFEIGHISFTLHSSTYSFDSSSSFHYQRIHIFARVLSFAQRNHGSFLRCYFVYSSAARIICAEGKYRFISRGCCREREIYRHFAMLDSIDLLFTNSQGVGSEIILRIGIQRNIIIYSIVTSYLYSRLKICGSELRENYLLHREMLIFVWSLRQPNF